MESETAQPAGQTGSVVESQNRTSSQGTTLGKQLSETKFEQSPSKAGSRLSATRNNVPSRGNLASQQSEKFESKYDSIKYILTLEPKERPKRMIQKLIDHFKTNKFLAETASTRDQETVTTLYRNLKMQECEPGEAVFRYGDRGV